MEDYLCCSPRHLYESEEGNEYSRGNMTLTMRGDKRITSLITMITRKIITNPVEVEVTNKPLLIIILFSFECSEDEMAALREMKSI